MKGLSLKELEFVIFDLETTGLYAENGDEMIELGALTLKNLEIQKETLTTFVNPGRTIPPQASAVHGIKDIDVKDAPSIEDVTHQFYNYIGSKVLVAHNAKFDMSFILKYFKKYQISFRQNIILDTVALSRFLFPYETTHNLDVVMARLGIAKTGDRHRSLSDCQYTSRVLVEFIHLLEKQGLSSLPDIKDCFVKPESIIKTVKPKSMGLFR